MALYLQARDGGKTDEKGLYHHINKLFPGEVVSGFTVTQQGTPNIGVTVAAGSVMVPSGNDYPYIGWNDASANLTITTADVSNARRDLVVVYVDLSVVSSVTPNNPNALKLAVVAGTPSGSPADPNNAAIHAIIGASNPYSILARVTVAAGATTITNSVITDMRSMARTANINLGPVFSRVDTTQTTTSTSYTDLATAGPAVTATIGSNGLALVCIGALMDQSVADFANMSFAVSGASTIAAADNNACLQYNTNDRVVSRNILLTGLTPGSNTFTMKYKVGSGTGSFTYRTIAVIPF